MPANLGVGLAMRGRGALAATVCLLAAMLVAAAAEPQLQELDEAQVTAKAAWPLEDYLEFPRYDSVVISPGGTHLAAGWSEDNYQRRLSIIDFPSMKPLRSGVLQIYFGVSDLRWFDEERLMIQPDWPLRGLRRLRNPLGTMLVTDIKGRTLQELNPVPLGTLDAFDVQRRAEEQSLHGKHGPTAFGPVRIVSARTGEADQLLMQTLWAGRESSAAGYGVYQLDLRNGKQLRVASMPLRGGQVITGPEHRPVLVAGVNALDEQLVYYLPESARAAGTDWQLRVRSGSGERGLLPVAWAGTGEEYFALDGRAGPTRAVVLWNARDNTQRLLYRHPDMDMDTAWLDPAGKPWMFSGGNGAPVYWYPRPAHPLAQLHRVLVQKLAPEHVDIMNATDDLATAVVRISSGRRPTIFLVVDVGKVKSITAMETFPKLRGRRLSPVDAIEFRARDGLMIHGYLTTPLDKDGNPWRGRPLLVISHSGPRGEAAGNSYDVERQLFASRGYAVLEVNARGSAGRGAAFEQAGDGKWGHEVQDDFVDAVRWAINEGATRAGQVCFYGTGYGAYSAMLAASRAPDLFQCVIGVAGIYDLPQIARTAESAYAVDGKQGGKQQIPLLMQRAFGNDLKELQARSAVSQAASIKAKVLLLHQDQDKQVPWEQLTAMRDALKAAGNRAQTESIGTENEGYFTVANRVSTYKFMLDFLDRQIAR